MMIASIQSDINLVLMLFACFIGLAIGMVMLAAQVACRKIKDDFRQEGGMKGWAKKSAPKAAGKVLRRIVLGMW